MAEWGGQEAGQRWAPLTEVAAAYGVSIDTIRRRMKRGELEARRQQTPQGFKWLAVMPEPTPAETITIAPGSPRTNDRAAQGVTIVPHDREELVETLRHELALRNREITRLHEVIASQAKAIEVTTAALPANVQTIEYPASAPAMMTGTGNTRDHVSAQQETLWARVRKWFGG